MQQPSEKAKVATRPSVFLYSNYREFLQDFTSYCRIQIPAFSFRYFAKKAGFRSYSVLPSVINKKRNLSEKSAKKICKAFKLTPSESYYFIRLVEQNQSSSAHLSEQLKEELSDFKSTLRLMNEEETNEETSGEISFDLNSIDADQIRKIMLWLLQQSATSQESASRKLKIDFSFKITE